MFGESNQASSIEVSTGGITPFKGKKGIPPKLYFTGFQSKSFLGEVQDKDDRNLFSGLVKKHMAKPMERITNDFAKSMGLQDDAPVVIGKGQVIKSGFHKELDELRSLSSDAKEVLLSIQQREIEATGIPSLKIAYNNVFGYYLEVRNTHKI